MKKIIYLMILIMVSVFPHIAYAVQESVQSNSVITQFGNAPLDQKPTGAGTDLSKAAQNLIEAYSICPPANKSDYISEERTRCLQAFLKTRGYSDQTLAAFAARRVSSTTSANCAECLGFVALSLTLISGDANALLGSPIERVNISNPVYVYNKLNKFPAGQFTYSLKDKMEEGAIGMGISHPKETLSSSGHTLIVKKVLGNIKFTAYESSFGQICQVTSDKEHVIDAYKFYNK